MGCFCRHSVEQLQEKLRQLDHSAPDSSRTAPASAPATTTAASASGAGQAAETAAASQDARHVAAAADALASRALPDEPWQPNPAWRAITLPTPQLPPESLATISALATLRAQSQAAFGLDPLQPEQAKQLARVVATLNERLKQMAASAPLPDPTPWHHLAAESEAADTVQQAAKAGLLNPSPATIAAYSHPAGVPMQHWLPLLRQVRALAPAIAAAKLLDEPLTDPQSLAPRLAEAVRKLRSLDLPPPAESAQAAHLMSVLSATTRLQKSLGIDPTQAGYTAVRQAVAEKTRAAAAVLTRAQSSQGQSASSSAQAASHGAAKTAAQAAASIPYCPTRFAPPAVIEAAQSEGARALAAIGWKVPPAGSLPALQSGLPTTTLAAQIKAVLGVSAVRPTPCGQDCDAARLMRAAG